MAQPTQRPAPAVPPDAVAIFRAVAAELAPHVDMWQRILAAHTRTESGHCAARGCGRPGYGTHDWQLHPCGVRGLAEAARALHG